MGRVKCLIISLGLLLVAQVALARDIEHFIDKQGTVHITNLAPRERGNRGKPGHPEVPLPPASLPTKSPDHSAARVPAPQAQPQDLKPGAAPSAPRPGLRISQPEGSTEARPATHRPGVRDEAAATAMGAALPFQRVSWSPPPPSAQAVRPGKIAVYRDRQGLIHISNVPKEEKPPLAPATRVAAMEQPALPPAVLLPAWQRASWPVGAPVPAASPEARARAPSPALTSKTIHRYLDRRGVLHITNLLPPDRPLLQAKLAAPTGKIMDPVAHSPPAAPVTPAISVESQAPLPGLTAPAFKEASCTRLGPEVAAYIEDRLRAASRVLAGKTIHRYLDRHGVWHITSNSPREPPSGPTQLAAAKIVRPASATGLDLSRTPPVMTWETAFGRPPPGLTGRTVIARRDRRGVLHIFSRATVQLTGGRDSPMAFLRRVPPVLQFCIMEAAHLYGLPVPLVLALIRQESNFVPQAISPKGAMGLMQLMPGTADLLGVRDPFAPRENILAGCRYFRFLLNYFQGSVPLALAAYNAGSQRVIAAGYRVPAIKETQEFVTRVMGLYCLLEKHAARL